MKQKVQYFRADAAFSPEHFARELSRLIWEIKREEKKGQVLFLCIGSDRSTGDSLGPLTGYMLTRMAIPDDWKPKVLGTLSRPVHAINLPETVERIGKEHQDAVVIAIDASIGTREHVGYITLSKGAMRPGLGVSKNLAAVGHISITGIVGSQGHFEPLLLQNTRLSVVMDMADCISRGIENMGFLSRTFSQQSPGSDNLCVRSVV